MNYKLQIANTKFHINNKARIIRKLLAFQPTRIEIKLERQNLQESRTNSAYNKNMNQFLDQILNPVPAVKRKSQTQNNSEVKRKVFQENRVDREMVFDEHQSQQGQSHNQNDEYQREQVTEQVIFQEDKKKIYNSSSNNGYSENNKSHQNRNLVNSNEIFSHFNHKKQSYQDQHNLNFQTEQHTEQFALQDQIQVFHNQQKASEGRIFRPKIVQDLINEINSAKQCQIQFLNWFSYQKSQFNVIIFQIVKEIQFKMKQVAQNVKKSYREEIQTQLRSQLQIQSQNNYEVNTTLGKESLPMQRKWQIQKKLIKQQLEQRYQYRIQKLEQQLEQKSKYEQQIMDSYQRELNSNKASQNQFFDAQKLNQQLQQLKIQLQNKEILNNQLEMENERLNQHIFDVEQKIQGIELEVQTRVRQRVKQLENQSHTLQQNQIPQRNQLHPILESSSHLQQSSKVFGLQSININSQKFDELINQNQHLKIQLEQIHYQKITIENQLKQHDKIINFREEQIKKNEEDINFQWDEIQRERQTLFMRQQQLTTAEENISKKISQIRIKQTQLQKWNHDLHKREIGLDFREQQIKKKIQEVVERENQIKTQKQTIAKLQKQGYSNLSNNLSRKNIQQFNVQGGGSFRKPDMEIMHLPIGRKSVQEPDLKQQRSFQNQYQFKSKGDFMKGNLQRSFEDMDKSYSRLNKDRQRMGINANNIRPGRQNHHQYVLPQNPKVQQKSRSKSKSKEKSILRNNFNPSSVSSGYKSTSYKSNGRHVDEFYQHKQVSNLDGLGSKLQRLRDEIKRQIDSIK